MENGEKLQAENNVYNEARDNNNFDVQSKSQVRGVNLTIFWNDRSSSFSTKVFGIDTAVIHTGT